MFLKHRRHQPLSTVVRARHSLTLPRPAVDALESRRLLSLTVDLRTADGTNVITASAVGQTFTLQMWADVTSATQPATHPNGLLEIGGTIVNLSGNTSAAPSNFPFDDTVAATISASFTASYHTGGDYSAGQNDSTGDLNGFDADPNSAVLAGPGNSVSVGNADEFLIGTLTLTINQLGDFDDQIAAYAVPSAKETGYVPDDWIENGVTVNNGFFNTGTTVTVYGPPPVANDASATALAGQATSLEDNTTDQAVDADFNIVTPPPRHLQLPPPKRPDLHPRPRLHRPGLLPIHTDR